MSEYSTAEINRDLELLTEKVTKLAIEGESLKHQSSHSLRMFFFRYRMLAYLIVESDSPSD